MPQNSRQLPIEEIRAQFTQQLREEAPMVVVAPTGPGKSTCLPVWMSDAVTGPVLVVEPRRVACRSLAGFVATQMRTNLGAGVGFRIRFMDKSSPGTRVLFVTPGVALRMLRDPNDFPFAGVMIDEFHERGWEVDLLLTILLRRRKGGKKSMPLVITSATIDAAALAGGIGATVLEASGRTFPVTTQYLGDDPVPTDFNLERRVADAVNHVWREEPAGGDILVFLPGKREIEGCFGALSPLAQRHNVQLHRIHGTLPTEQVARALEAHSGQRRIFLSTNVAETSLTVPNVTTVIDSGLVRTRAHRAGRSSLVLQPTSAASMDQRAGRAGRVAPGRCIRLWDEKYRGVTETPPEVTRIELDDVLLHAAACGLDIADSSCEPWPTEPPGFAAAAAFERLQALEAVDRQGRITEHGLGLMRLPVSVHEARLLIDVPKPLAGAAADLVALFQVRGNLLLGTWHLDPVERQEVDRERRKLLRGARDEVYANLAALRHGHAAKHHLHRTGLIEARKLSAALRKLMKCTEVAPEKDSSALPPPRDLAAFLLRRWPEAGFVLRDRALKKGRGPDDSRKKSRGEPWGNGEVELSVTPYPGWGEDDTDRAKWPVAGLILEHEWIGRKGLGVQGMGNMLLPCTYKDLAAAGLGEDNVGEVQTTGRRDAPKIVGTLKREYAGVTIDTTETPLSGASLRTAVARLIHEGRLLTKVGPLVMDDLHLARLLCTWPDREILAPPPYQPEDFADVQVYLRDKLAELGVEASEDLPLVEARDLCPDLETLFGISDYHLSQLRKDFPRQWTLHGAVYDCSVNPVRRVVDLTPVNKLAKTKVPEAWLLPAFRHFGVRYRKASRVVQLR